MIPAPEKCAHCGKKLGFEADEARNDLSLWRQLTPAGEPEKCDHWDFDLCDQCAIYFQETFCGKREDDVVRIVRPRGVCRCAHCGVEVDTSGVGWGGVISEMPEPDMPDVGSEADDTLCKECVDVVLCWCGS